MNWFKNSGKSSSVLREVFVDPKWAQGQFSWRIQDIRLIILVSFGSCLVALIQGGKSLIIGIPALGVIWVLIYFLFVYLRRSSFGDRIVFWSDRSITVRYNLSNVTLKPTDSPIEVRQANNGKSWIIGKGIGILSRKSIRVPVAAFPRLGEVYQELLNGTN